MAALSLRALASTKSRTRALIRPTSNPRRMDCEKECTPRPCTSLSTKADSRRAASREYSGSSKMNEAAVRIDSSSSSRGVAPSYSPAMVLSATRIGSTSCRPSQQRVTARTILLTSTGSRLPLRLVTPMGLRAALGCVRRKLAWGRAPLASAVSDVSKDIAFPLLAGGLRECGCHEPHVRTRFRQLLPREPSAIPWQATVTTAGLRTLGRRALLRKKWATYWAPLPGALSEPSAMAPVVPEYRCGAAPALAIRPHRIPC